jgi:bifunctional DNA-binding transcriptional regulator/antitoxin component of YhaV-PrlF toxin-antitoxin module
MEHDNKRVIGKCFGTTVLGSRGQLVIPVEARKELGIDAHSKLLVFGHSDGWGLFLVKVETAEELLNVVSSRINELADLIKDSKASGVASESDGS